MWGLFLWAVFAVFIMGVFLWSTAILFQQKKAWQAFAKKHNLIYEADRLLEPPIASGKIGSYKMSFFTDVQRTQDVRGKRTVTVIEVEMGLGMSAAAALATKEYKDFIAELDLPDSFDPDMPATDWSPHHIIKTKDVEKLKLYLTTERLKTLQSLFAMRNATALFFFDTHEAVLRIETPDPLRDAVHMDKITTRLVHSLDILKPTAAEQKKWGNAPPEQKPETDQAT